MYFSCINYNKEVQPDLETLFELQKAHLKSVPFENLDIHYGRKIVLDIAAIYQKIVIEKRGGFCYELNGLFCSLLKEIGFNAKMISAKVFAGDGKYGKQYDHLAIIVRLNNLDYLVDVGFGKFAFEPLLIEVGKPQKDAFGVFQFDKFDADYFSVNEVVKGELIPQYIFKLDARKLNEFEEMCHFHQTSSNSHFTRKKVISIVTQNGRITLDSEKLKITKNGISQEILIKNKREFNEFLKHYFDIKISKKK